MRYRSIGGTMLTRALLRAPLAALLVTVLIAAASPAAARQGAQPAAPAPATTDQIIVQLRSGGALDAEAGARPAAAASRLTALAGADLAYVRAGDTPGMHIVALPADLPLAEVEAAAQRIAASPEVLYAEPDRRVRIARTPTDPRFAGQMWHLQALVATGNVNGANNYGANLPAAWDITTGSASIVAAVIDTGGLLTHEDLAGRAPAGNPGYDMIVDTDISNDGNGRDADPSDPGDWITAAEDASGPLQNCGESDSSWHGSHVAGTIGASTNNGKGIAGINWVSKLLHMRALGKCGGYNSDIAAAIRWAAGLPVAGLAATNPNPARVINMSLGGFGTCGTTLQDAINAAVGAGSVLVVAAGNENLNLNEPGNDVNPAECNNVIAVASTNQDGNRAYYSNYGSMVSLAAPGGDASNDPMIMSTINSGTQGPVADAYATYQGTSMATPHVAGVVSLMLSANPDLTPAQVKSILEDTVTPFPGYSDCSTSTCGAGILNAAKAVDEAARRVRTVSWQDATLSVSEAAGTVSIPVRLSIPSSSSVSVPFTVSGTSGAADHDLVAGSVTFAAGSASASISFDVTDDALEEGNETVVITLGTPGGSPQAATIAGPASHTLTIVENDGAPAEPTLTIDSVGVAETGAAVDVTFTVRRDGPDATAGASYTVRAKAMSGALRQVASGTVSVVAGEFTSDVTVSIPRDELGLAQAVEVSLSSQLVELAAPQRLYLPLQTK